MTSVKYRLPVLALMLGFLISCSSINRFAPALQDSLEIGMALFDQGEFASAIPHLKEATRENPRSAQAYLFLGRAYISQSQWRAAIPPLRTAFRLSPREAQEEISNLLIDALFAAALNDFNLGGAPAAPLRPRSTL